MSWKSNTAAPSIGLSVIDEVREKTLRLPVDRRQSVRTVLVYEGVLDRRVEAEDYFDYIIPFSRLLAEPTGT